MIEAACCGRKDLAMRKQRRFPAEFKRQQEAALKDRIAKLEQMVGRLTMENEFLKKALENTLEKAEQKESSLATTEPLCERSEGGANS